jgi:hypothetical protein
MGATLTSSPKLTLGAFLAAGLCCLAMSLGLAQQAQADALLPAPTILSGPADGSTINTDGASFVFDALDSLSGGTLISYLCSVDGAPPVACDSSYSLTGLSDGLHTLGLSASILPLGGVPVCVLTVCLPLPSIPVVTDTLTRTFTVVTSVVPIGPPVLPATGSSSTTTNNSGSAGAAGDDRVHAFSLAWSKYKRQQTKCKAMKKRVKKYRSHTNRMHAAKRYKGCLKTQKRLRAKAMSLAR